MSEVICYHEGGETFAGLYDGHGALIDYHGDMVHELDAHDNPCVWHKSCWSVTPESFRAKYTPSKPAPDCGYYFDEKAHQMPEPRVTRQVH